MTDAEFLELEYKAKAAQDETEGAWDVSGEGKTISTFIAAANPAAILELIAELRQARKERDYLISCMISARPPLGCPSVETFRECTQTVMNRKRTKCFECVLKAVKNRPCQKGKGKKND